MQARVRYDLLFKSIIHINIRRRCGFFQPMPFEDWKAASMPLLCKLPTYRSSLILEDPERSDFMGRNEGMSVVLEMA